MNSTSQMNAAQSVTDTEKGITLACVEVAGPPELVFRALSEKDEIENWWGSDNTYHMRDYKADFRVGGEYSIVGAGVDGSRFPAHGEFVEIIAPCKLSYTRQYDWDFPVLGRRATTISFLLEPTPSGTRVTLRHEGFKGCPDAALIHGDGWKHVLDWLQARVNSDVGEVANMSAHAPLSNASKQDGNVPAWWSR